MARKQKTNDVVETFFANAKEKSVATALAIRNGIVITFKWVKYNWLKAMVLIASATQTFALIHFFAPEWAFWLPYIGVMLMEGAIPLWQEREENADAADGSIDDKEKNAQERIANGMIWVCIFMSAITMVGGALVEVSTSQMTDILKPNAQVTSAMGWASIVGIFLLGSLHLVFDWRFRRADPFRKLEREHRAALRAFERKRRKAVLDGEELTIKTELNHLRHLYRQGARSIGRSRAEEMFADDTGDLKTVNKTQSKEVQRKANVKKKREEKLRTPEQLKDWTRLDMPDED